MEIKDNKGTNKESKPKIRAVSFGDAHKVTGEGRITVRGRKGLYEVTVIRRRLVRPSKTV